MNNHYTLAEDNLLKELAYGEKSFKEIYEIFKVSFPHRSKLSVKERFYLRLKLQGYNKKNNYTKDEYDYIKKNLYSYRLNGALKFESFIKDFNSKFENKITKPILKNLMRKLNIKVGKPDYVKVMSLRDNTQHAIGDEVTFPSGYTFIKVACIIDNTIPSHKLYQKNWKAKHVLIYEQHHNVKVKHNEAVVFIDTNRNNFAIDNLMLISRKELGKMLQFNHIKDVEIRKTAYTICKTECMLEKLIKLLQAANFDEFEENDER